MYLNRLFFCKSDYNVYLFFSILPLVNVLWKCNCIVDMKWLVFVSPYLKMKTFVRLSQHLKKIVCELEI